MVLASFTHDENDDASFQMITAQFYCNGYVKQMDIVRAFGVTPISVKRAGKRYKEEGVQGFYAEKRRERCFDECCLATSPAVIKRRPGHCDVTS